MKSSAANTDRIAVAGGRGFIGRAISRTLLARRKQVLAFGREGLSDPTIITTLIWAAGGREGGDIARLAESHVLAPLRVIAHAPNLRRLVYLSSGEVYGPGAVPFHEDSPRLGRSPYAQAKIRGEDELTAACARAGIALIILRPGVVYGPGQAATMLIPALLAALRAGQPFRTTAGEQTRDFLHIDDLVRLLVRCLDDDAPPGTYNAGTGVETPVRAVIQTLAARLGRPDLIDLGALPYRPGEAMRYVLDPARASAQLGFRAAVDLDAGLGTLICSPGDP